MANLSWTGSSAPSWEGRAGRRRRPSRRRSRTTGEKRLRCDTHTTVTSFHRLCADVDIIPKQEIREHATPGVLESALDVFSNFELLGKPMQVS